ncbi:MAG: methionine aminopeptidase type [Bacteroidetes bacterium]|jgi:methionyl aminopeptidase|nr:methionine aminopeptidase type [Bacteroidota bacterium]
MIYLKTREELELMRESAQCVSRTLGMLAKEIKEGVELKRLDKLAEEFIREMGGVPSFKGYPGPTPFPASLCLSINEQVVHGIPGDRVVKDGDILAVDCGVFKNGFHGDHAYTFCIGNVKPEVRKMVEVTKESLYKGIEQVTANNRIGDISYAIQQHAESHGYGVVRELVGHGLGRHLHEDPQVPNYGRRGTGPKLRDGMVIAIEPMINLGKKEVRTLSDKWTIVTRDGLPSAHFEHDVALIDGKAEILSTFDYVEEALGILKSAN